VGVTGIESNRNRHFGLKIESKSIENRNLEIVTSLVFFLNTVYIIIIIIKQENDYSDVKQL